MRVLHIGAMYPPHHLGGYELVWRSAVHHMRAAGHDARVLTTDFALPEAGPEWDPDVHRELRWRWRDHAFPRIGVRDSIRLERHNAEALGRQLDDLRPEAAAFWAMGGMSLSLIERVHRAGVPTLAVAGDDWPVYARMVDPMARLPFRLAGPLVGLSPLPGGLAGIDHWLFISEQALSAAAYAGVEAPADAVIHPGVDTARFRPEPPREWGWRLLYAGRIDPRKGVLLCVEALAELPAEATLRIDGAGDGEHVGELRELVAARGLGERVEIARSSVEEVPARYAEADVVLFPVLWDEPWGLVPLEAMTVGRPVVASGRGGSGEYLRDGENALVVDPDEGPPALAAAVRALAEDEPLRQKLIVGGAETAAMYPQSAFDERVLHELEAVVLR